MGLKLFHTGDLHYCAEHLEEVDRCFEFAIEQAIYNQCQIAVEVDRCFEFAIEQAIYNQCQIAVIAGDLFDHRVDLHSPAVNAICKRVRRLADHMPVLILAGTFSHDVPGSLNIFRTMGGKHPVHVADRICQVAYSSFNGWTESQEWAFGFTQDIPELTALFSCLPPINKAQVAAMAGTENVSMATGEYVYDLMRGWSVVNMEVRKAGIPTIVCAHGTVAGSITEQGCVMAGLDWEMTTGTLFAADASATLLAHIHQHQEWEHGGRRIAYPGSIGRLHFGEVNPKGFLIWDVQPDSATCDFIETPAKRLLQIDFPGVPDMAELERQAANAAGAHVRIRASVDEEFRSSINREAIHALFKDAADLSVEIRVNPIQRSRSEGINRAVSLNDKLTKWGEVTQTDADALLERLAFLEHQEPEQIVKSVMKEGEETKAKVA